MNVADRHEKMVAILRRHEWVATPGVVGALCCLECGAKESYGHGLDCALAALLADEPKPTLESVVDDFFAQLQVWSTNTMKLRLLDHLRAAGCTIGENR